MPTQFSKTSLFGIPYASVDYASATRIIIENALTRTSFGVSALAVHGLMESKHNETIGQHVSRINMVVPDGKPVQWALNAFNKADLKDRVYGPDLTRHVLKAAGEQHLKVYLYGSTESTLTKLKEYIPQTFPGVTICGIHVDRFRDATPEEKAEDIKKINASGANIVLVGRGCPRQEIWVSQHLGEVNAVMMAVGAAFDYFVGNIKRPPVWMQQSGLEWLFRLSQEPRRLFKRYAVTNSQYIFYVVQKLISQRVLGITTQR
ncbi:WecB/TagA/CpsF family glycosyltransferase [Spirosoma linguale]|uniref:Glycosyl transferase, WecB/TagA/CpsF family n=1 Tax=Spirosoma linguale (strain ATCC 33905 / DSM 74 / LMG 10896 / Claus 1) TaxID=504472 RepID=D2QU87_SPILD|nr:glycosyl transferase, WecB/TagA/CpsF family [Spirosoma linguale DSM 74]